MPRREEFPVKLKFAISAEMDAEINDWRRKQPDLPPRTEAIRRLVAMALHSPWATLFGEKPAKAKRRKRGAMPVYPARED